MTAKLDQPVVGWSRVWSRSSRSSRDYSQKRDRGDERDQTRDTQNSRNLLINKGRDERDENSHGGARTGASAGARDIKPRMGARAHVRPRARALVTSVTFTKKWDVVGIEREPRASLAIYLQRLISEHGRPCGSSIIKMLAALAALLRKAVVSIKITDDPIPAVRSSSAHHTTIGARGSRPHLAFEHKSAESLLMPSAMNASRARLAHA